MNEKRAVVEFKWRGAIYKVQYGWESEEDYIEKYLGIFRIACTYKGDDVIPVINEKYGDVEVMATDKVDDELGDCIEVEF